MPADLTVAVIGAAAIIIASVIGLIVAVTTAVIAKEQKVSEFRQAWINDFRKENAEFYALVLESNHNIFNAYKIKLESNKHSESGKTPPKTNEMLTIYNSKFTEATKVGSLIRFRLNPERDVDYINDMYFILKNMSNYKNLETYDELQSLYSEIQKRIHNFSKHTHVILKNEWERVKKGEKHFVKFRGYGELCLFAFITAFFVVLAFVKIPELAILLN